MSIANLSVAQLQRAVALKQRIDALNRELNSLLGTPTQAAPTKGGRGKISAAGRARIAAAARARWARIKGAVQSLASPFKPAKRRMSAAGRARIVAAAKARWARFHAAKKA